MSIVWLVGASMVCCVMQIIIWAPCHCCFLLYRINAPKLYLKHYVTVVTSKSEYAFNGESSFVSGVKKIVCCISGMAGTQAWFKEFPSKWASP